MLDRFSRFTLRFRLPIVVFWLVCAGFIFFLAPSLADLAEYSSQGFLPPSADSRRAEALLAEIAGPRVGQSSLMVIVSRESGLTEADMDTARALLRAIEARSTEWKIQTLVHPWLSPEHQGQLIDPAGRTALIVLGLGASSWAPDMPRLVAELRELAARHSATSPSLAIHVSGEAAFSADERALVSASMDTITGITIVLVLLVLMVVFRSPIAPILPLSVIGLSFLISRGLIAFLSLAGLPVSAYTETFLIAVLFGAGTDYCILLLSRYRDELAAGHDSLRALHIAQRSSTEAILSSGMATLAGFLCMAFALFGLYNSTGPAVALGVAVTILMVLTLTPALISFLGPRSFWPSKSNIRLGRWPAIAAFVRKKPGLVLVLTLAFFMPSLIASFQVQRSFDQVSEIPLQADSRAGFEILSRDFGQGMLMPIRLALKTEKDVWGIKALPVLENLAAALEKEEGVALVRGPTRPSGTRLDRLKGADGALLVPGPSREQFFLPKLVIANQPQLKSAMETFISPDGRSVYLDIILQDAPYTAQSINMVARLASLARQELQETHLAGATVEIGGPTAMFADVRDFTERDFGLVMILVLGTVFLVLVFLLRSIVAPVYLLATIMLSFVATMGLSHIVFHLILGYEGVNWAVQFFAFCVLVALGVDYNIFLMARVKEECHRVDFKTAVERALAGTGKIITTCGIIMVGCFAAMMVSPVRSIQEVGFAIVVGLLFDTFIIRSFMVPSLAILVGELSWWPSRSRVAKP